MHHLGKLTSKALLAGIVLGYAATFSPTGTLAEPEGELKIAQTPLLQRFDPINQVTVTDYIDISIIFDGLINLGPEGFYPALAEDWTVSEDGLTIDFNLREGVRFSNGDPFTAEDVQFTYEGILSEDSTNGHRSNYTGTIDAIEVIDPHHVRFHMKSPWASMFDQIRGGAIQAIVPKAYYQEVGPTGFQDKPVGTGPYKLESVKSGEWTRFVANEDYWQGPPNIKYVTLNLVPEPFTRLAQLMSGEVDIATGITGPLLQQARQTPNLRIVYARYTGTNALHFDRDSNPLFKDRRVRLAIAHAIDRELMADTILAGLCEPSTHFFSPGTFGHHPDLPHFSYDPELARDLLEEAGFTPGYQTDFVIHTEEFASTPNGPAMQEAIAGIMEELGFELTRKNYDTAAFLRAMRGFEFDGVFYGTSTIPKDGGGVMSSYYKSGNHPHQAQIAVPEYDEIYEKQLAEPDPDKRRALLHRFAELERENVEAVPLFWCHTSLILGPRVEEIHPGLGSSYHLNLEKAKLAN